MESIWSRQISIPEREALREDMETDVAVIGAGMAGILTAYKLQKSGLRVLVIEAGRIAGGQTRNTTAKITSQHGLIYQNLIQTQGERKARQYAAANEAAIRDYRSLIDEEGIDCDWEEQSAFVYAGDIRALKAEADAAARLGIPAEVVRDIPLPVKAAGAVRFVRQAQFHPLKFIAALSEGLRIFEHSRVISVEDNAVITKWGRVKAGKIVFACHYPFVDFPGMYFARMHQERSYVLALENAAQLDGMWVGAGPESFSFRNYGELLLLGGENHRSGKNSDGGCYERLRQKAREWFPDSRELACWSAQDCITPDRIPFIGRYSVLRPDWYVATGFQKWGMSSSMVSASLLRDIICGKKNPLAALFAPSRLNAKMLAGLVSEGAESAKGLGRNLFIRPKEKMAEIPSGHGEVVLRRGRKRGVYKEDNGTLHSVNSSCPHLGCQLEWNPDERSWDCPCHGSRFDRVGNLISGPAQKGIAYEK